MKTKIAINGFGRIGRNAFKIAFERDDLEILAINDLGDTKSLAHLLKHDSNYGTYHHKVDSDDTHIIVDDQSIRVLAEKEPADLPWEEMGIDVVIESTGLFTDPAKAKAHIDAGAKKVIISAPAKGEGSTTIVLGANEDQLAGAGDIINNGSCTTNCVTLVLAVLENTFGIEKSMMTTVHSYTASQRLQDSPAKDLREARNAATNIVPTSTGASISVAQAIPSLAGKFEGMSVRVPTPVGSIVDLVALLKRDVTAEEVNEAFKKAASEPFYQGLLAVTEEELVSSDYIGNSHSAIVDLPLTKVVGNNMVKVAAWYDNEWGYSNRLVELTADVGNLLHKPAESVAEPEPTIPVPTIPEATPEPEAEKMLEAPDSADEELLPPPPVPSAQEVPAAERTREARPSPRDFSDEVAELDQTLAGRSNGVKPTMTPEKPAGPKSIDIKSPGS